MMPEVRIQLLGCLRVERGSRSMTRFSTRKTATLLAYLAYHSRQPQPREELAEMLWPDSELPAARHSISQALSSLRHQLEPAGMRAGTVILADRHHVQLNPRAILTDVAEFTTALRRAEVATEAGEQRDELERAERLYQGELLPGHYQDWVLRERDRLIESFLRVLHRLRELAERAGEIDRALELAAKAVQVDTLREDSHRSLMWLLAEAGQSRGALRHYAGLVRLLQDELGVEPERETRALVARIRVGDDARRSSTTPAARTGGATGGASRRATGGASGRATGGASGRATGGARPDHDRSRLLTTATPPRRRPRRRRAPVGTVTVLLLDCPGQESASPAAGGGCGDPRATAGATVMPAVRRTLRGSGGFEVEWSPGQVNLLFASAADAAQTAIAVQRVVREQSGGARSDRDAPDPACRLRAALHTGEIAAAGDAMPGPVHDHTARLLRSGNGGQILCSESTAILIRDDLDPGQRLRDLGLYCLRNADEPERIFQLDRGGTSGQVFQPLDAPSHGRTNLPPLLTRFFGRQEEMARIRTLLMDERNRLVTILGTGGTGKTRISIELSGPLLTAFAGGVWFVELGQLSDPRVIDEAICQAMCIERERSRSPVDQIVEFLGEGPALLILDNLEHLLPAATGTIKTLLGQLAELRCLATSRRALRIDGERIFELRPLVVPTGPDTPSRLLRVDSVRLYVDRAQAVRPDFQLTRRNASHVAQLCARLEGIPLAIELAAARAQVMTPAQTLKRLTRRLDFLISRRQDTELRHRTMRAALEWSFELLPAELRTFFTRLSIFRGGWTVEAAEAVCQEPVAIDLLEQLRESSLVRAEEIEGEMRFQMLETVREFGGEKLDREEWSRLGGRHARYCLDFKRELNALLDSGQQPIGMARLAAEQDNLRAALDWCEECEATGLGLELANELTIFWLMRGQEAEGVARFERLLARPHRDLEERLLASAWLEMGQLYGNLGRLDENRRCLEDALGLTRRQGDRLTEAKVLNSLAVLAQDRGQLPLAQELGEQVLEIYTEIGHERFRAQAMHNLGVVANALTDYPAARRYFEQSLEIKRQIGVPRDVATTLNGLGNLTENLGDYVASRRYHEECLSISREIGDERLAGYCLGNLAMLASHDGRGEEALHLLRQSLAINQQAGARRMVYLALEMMGAIRGLEGRDDWSTRLIAAAERMGAEMGMEPMGGMGQAWQERVDDLRRSLGEVEFERCWAQGQAMTDAEATALAMGEEGGVQEEDNSAEATSTDPI